MPDRAERIVMFHGYYDRIHRVFRDRDGNLLYVPEELLPIDAQREATGYFKVAVTFREGPQDP
jgi:hypothetical protein